MTNYIIGELDDNEKWRIGANCMWCGHAVSYQKEQSPRQATREHVIARSLGGENKPENVGVACHLCNSGRGNSMTWVRWKDLPGYLQKRMKPYKMTVVNGKASYVDALTLNSGQRKRLRRASVLVTSGRIY